jgi:hypothetical protein
MLLRREEWRQQVLMIQGYIPIMSQQSGLYSQKPHVRSKLDAPTRETISADEFSKSIARYIERSYAAQSSPDNLAIETAGVKPVNLKVDSMQCRFGLDPTERSIFLYAEYTAVEIKTNRFEVEEMLRNEKLGREQTAAGKIYQEFLTLLLKAYEKGDTIENLFHYFDFKKNFFISVEDLINGLAKLGIGLTYPVGEHVLQLIGGVGKDFLTLNDFQNCLKNALNEKYSLGEFSPPKITTQEEINEVKRKKDFQKTKKLNELYPPEKDPKILERIALDIQKSQTYNWNHRDDVAIKMQEEKKQKGPMGPLPLPEEMYTTNPQHEQKPLLAPWAAQRTKRALKDLHESQAKSTKRKIGEQQTKAVSSSLFASTAGSSALATSSSAKVVGESKSRTGSPKKMTRAKSMKSVSSLDSSLDLQTIVSDPTHLNLLFVNDSPDELLHLDGGVVMTYRILDGLEIHQRNIRTKEQSDSLRYHSFLSERDRNMKKPADMDGNDGMAKESEDISMGSEMKKMDSSEEYIDNNNSFTLVVIPDLTMTLDTLQNQLEILLHTHPLIKIVLVGLIGLPNTQWPVSWVVNSELQSKCIGNLLTHLFNSGKLFYQPLTDNKLPVDRNLVLMGFGLGVYHLSRFISEILPSLDAVLQSSVKHFVFVNGILKYSKKFKKLCKDLRSALLQANVYEANELITSLHFFDDYLMTNNREHCLKQFWSTRRSLYPKDANSSMNASSFLPDEQQGENAMMNFKGVLEQLKGILISPEEYDGALILVQNETPVIVIQGTEDVFIDPKSAAIFSSQQLPPERILVRNIEDTAQPGTVHVSWLKAGHEILQERNAFVLSSISQIAKFYGLSAVHQKESDKEQKSQQASDSFNAGEDDDLFDVLQYGQQSVSTNKRKKQIDLGGGEGGEFLKFDLEEEPSDEKNTKESTEDQETGDDDFKVLALSTDTKDQFLDEEKGHSLDAESEDHEEADKKQHQMMEKLQKAKLNIEKRKRQIRQSRTHHMEIFYQREQEERDRQHERNETKLMTKEDQRSRHASNYLIETEINELSRQIAREKALEMKRLRKEEAIKRVEEEMARKRSERIEIRRKQAMDLVTKIEQEELILQGMKEGGGYELPPESVRLDNINEVIEASHRILKDLIECRQKYIESIKRCSLMQEKYDLFYQQLTSLENEEKRLIRAIRLIEINPSVVGNELNAQQQLSELRSSLLHKQEILAEMRGVIKERERQLYASNKSVQILKLATKERNLLMSMRLQELNRVEILLNNKVKELKMLKEQATVEKDRLRLKLITLQNRIDSLSKEYNRIKTHKAKLIDTDIWIEGVMQRFQTRELKSYLKKEIKRMEVDKKEIMKHLDELKLTILNFSDSLALKRRDSDKINLVIKVLYKSFETLQSKKIEDIVDHLLNIQQKAVNLENRRHKEMNLEKQILSSNHHLSLIDKIRLKDYELRNKDERQFIGIDLILYPNEYLALTSVEIEQMSFDEDYQCHLSKSDLQRILKLPEAINLALPFLHTVEEVNCHRLIMKYYKNRDENFYKNLDFITYERLLNPLMSSLGHLKKVPSVEGLPTGPSVDDMSLMTDEFSVSLQTDLFSIVNMKNVQEAEVIHDILVKESLRDRLRCSYGDENLTEEEKQFIIIDKILFPHIYGFDEEINTVTKSHLIRQREEQESELNAFERNVQAEMQSRSIQSLNNIVNKNASVPGKKPMQSNRYFDARKGEKADTSKEGDLYEVLREHFHNYSNSLVQEGGMEDLFQYYWSCPFNRQEILQIGRKPAIQCTSDEERHIKKLLDKYYLSDEESILGHSKCQQLEDVSKKVLRIMFKTEKRAKRDVKSHHRSFKNEMIESENMKKKTRDLLEELDQDEDALTVEDGDHKNDSFDSFEVSPPAGENGKYPKDQKKLKPGLALQMPGFKNSKGDLEVGTPHSMGNTTLSSPAASENSRLVKGMSNRFVVPLVELSEDEDEKEAVKEDKKELLNIRRIWGSWQTVHPASQGSESQTSYFMVSTYNATRDHPAAFALHHEQDDDEDGSEGSISSKEEGEDDEEGQEVENKKGAEVVERPGTAASDVFQKEKDANDQLRQKGMQLLLNRDGGTNSKNRLKTQQTGLTSEGSHSIRKSKSKSKKKKAPKNPYHICEEIQELAQQDPLKVRGKIILLQVKEPMTLFTINDSMIQARQSRSHYFSIPDKESVRVIEFTVSIVFQGNFTTHGYKLGRIAASLFRLPDTEPGATEAEAGGLPIPIGYSPYDLCSPNLPHSMGRILLFHRPKDKPIKPGTFQIVIGSASVSKYSIEVVAKYARAALPVVDEQYVKAKQMQTRLPVCLVELDTIAESVILAERKLLVCEKLVEEAELESNRTQAGIKLIRDKLLKDDEELFLTEDERRDLLREVTILETEYAQWSKILSSRLTEKQDIRDGIQQMYSFQRDREKEKADIQRDLETDRRDLPACYRILRNMSEAVNIANVLNTIVAGVSEEVGSAATGDFGGIKLSTPAEDVRRAVKQYGFDSLTIEEQQWCLLDQSMNPGKYDWLKEQEEKERQERIILGKAPKEKKKNILLEPFELSKSEIDYILATPFSMLTRREVTIRKLFTKYHDDVEHMKRSIATVGLSFDPHLAEKTRAKDPRAYTKEEKEWASLDRILHPEIWEFYVHKTHNFLDRHQQEATIDPNGDNHHKGKKKKTKKSKGEGGEASATEDEGKEKDAKGAKGKQQKKTKEEEKKEKEKEEEKKADTTPISLEGGEDLNTILDRMQRTASVKLRKATQLKELENLKVKSREVWTCQLDREGIIKIWRTPRAFLKTTNEQKIHQLLHKYNGNYISYLNIIEESNKRKNKMSKEGAHIQWEKTGKLTSKDIDFRARQLLREIDRAMNTKNEYIQSDVLHANDQKFPTSVLRTHLEEALDQFLIDQIKDRERAEMVRVQPDTDPSDSSSEDEDLSSEEDEATFNDDSSLNRYAKKKKDEARKKKLQRKKQNELIGGREVNIEEEFNVRDFKHSENDSVMQPGGTQNPGRQQILKKVKRRSEKRHQRKQYLKVLNEEEEVMKTKKMLQLNQQKQQEENKLQQQLSLPSKDAMKSFETSLGFSSNYCLACRTKKCQWKSSIDYEVVIKRKRELDEEIERIRLDKHSQVFTSNVALSTQLGGNNVFKRADLLEELYSEAAEIELRINLDQIDLELHDSYACKAEYFESNFLHGYSILLFTNHARIALEARQSRLVAMTVAKEIVDDILDFMLEGWVFGERQSNFHALGYVPSIKKTGMIAAGQDQISSVTSVIARMKKRADDKRNSLKNDETQRGKMLEKAYEIELQAQNKTTVRKVVDQKKEFKHLLNETEQTLKYGIFMLTLMYFRAMVYLRRDQESLRGKNDLLGGKNNSKNNRMMTNERMQMMNEENKIKIRQKKIDLILAKSQVGAQRRKEREMAERREAILKLQSIIRRQKLEILSVTIIQKVYRGHLGRKAAKRWALKRAELGAMNALLNATAITIQRVFRGHRDRNYARIKRQEMAQFIALMRVQESQQDEEIYWQTHPWTRFKKNQKEWLQAKWEQRKAMGALGQSRLNNEEQAELEGKSIDEIKRELEGLDDDDNDWQEEGNNQLGPLSIKNPGLGHASSKSSAPSAASYDSSEM